jgi:hypothetical protein
MLDVGLPPLEPMDPETVRLLLSAWRRRQAIVFCYLPGVPRAPCLLRVPDRAEASPRGWRT